MATLLSPLAELDSRHGDTCPEEILPQQHLLSLAQTQRAPGPSDCFSSKRDPHPSAERSLPGSSPARLHFPGELLRIWPLRAGCPRASDARLSRVKMGKIKPSPLPSRRGKTLPFRRAGGRPGTNMAGLPQGRARGRAARQAAPAPRARHPAVLQRACCTAP